VEVMSVGNVKIKLIDGEEMVISDIDQYGLTPDNAAYFVARYGYKIFLTQAKLSILAENSI
jgi:hypothetical protein